MGNTQSSIVIEFIGVDKDFSRSLEIEFPEEEIVSRSAFSGTEIVTIITTWSASFINKVATFLISKKTSEAARKIRIKIGSNEIELTGFGGEDVRTMQESLTELAGQLRDT